MADISSEIAAFRNAVYGEDVRSAMVSLTNKLNAVVSSLSDTALVVKTLSNTSDFNDLVNESALYLMSSPNNYVNAPGSTSSGILLVIIGSGHSRQLVYNANDDCFYTRFYLSGTWRSWNRIDEVDLSSYMHVAHPSNSGTHSLDDCAINTAGWYAPSAWTDHPDFITGAFWVVTYGKSGQKLQLVYQPSTGACGFRACVTDTWRDWRDLSDKQPLIPKVMSSSITSFDELTEPGIWFKSSSLHIDDLPADYASTAPFIIYTTPVGINTLWQFAVAMNTGDVFSRWKSIHSDTWRAWGYDSQYNKNAVFYAFGDSTTYGQIGGIGGQSSNNWPKIVSKALHMKVSNNAKGGQGLCKDWDYIHENYLTLDLSDASIIAVAWAYNDGSAWGRLPLGDYDSTDSTSVIGKYYTILSEFQQQAPQAMVVLVTGFGRPGPTVDGIADFQNQFTDTYTFQDRTVTVKQFYDMLEAMANRNGWSCINQSNGCCFNHFNCRNWFGDNIHPTHAGYLYYGNYLAGKFQALWGNIA